MCDEMVAIKRYARKCGVSLVDAAKFAEEDELVPCGTAESIRLDELDKYWDDRLSSTERIING